MLHEENMSMKFYQQLRENNIEKIIAPFIPAPLIDKSLSLGYQHWLDKKAEDEFFVYFIN